MDKYDIECGQRKLSSFQGSATMKNLQEVKRKTEKSNFKLRSVQLW